MSVIDPQVNSARLGPAAVADIHNFIHAASRNQQGETRLPMACNTSQWRPILLPNCLEVQGKCLGDTQIDLHQDDRQDRDLVFQLAATVAN